MIGRYRTRSASVPKDDARLTEIINGVLVSKPSKKVTDLSKPDSEPEIIDLQEYARSSKAASVQSINKTKLLQTLSPAIK
jgi:pyruvate/2-oxoglutarate/acetoin dehydrogenase E1 component